MLRLNRVTGAQLLPKLLDRLLYVCSISLRWSEAWRARSMLEESLQWNAARP